MEQLRLAWANIQRTMGRLGPTHKLLFGSLAVIALMTLFLVSQYAAKPAMVDFMAVGTDSQTLSSLRAAGIEATIENGRVLVPAGMEHAAIAHLSETGQLPDDTTILFNNLMSSQDWKASQAQHRQQATIALQNELARVISKIRGIRQATVIIDAPEAAGLGRAVKQPSASVTVFTSGGIPLAQESVDAIARLVAGAKSGLAPADVQVIDGSTGRPRSVSDETAMAAGRYLEHKVEIERYTQRELERLLAYIPGVVVTVNAVVDVTRVAKTQQKYLPDKQGSVSMLRKETTSEEQTQNASRGMEPGLRSSSTADINAGASSSGSGSSVSTGDTEFQIGMGTEMTQVEDPRGMPTYLSASVTVPQAFIEELVRRSRAEDQKDQPVTTDEARAYFDDLRDILQEQILTRLETTDEQGQLRPGKLSLAMMPMPVGDSVGMTTAGMMGLAGVGGAGGGGVGGLFSASGLVETVVLGVLALVAVVMMFTVVRRSARPADLPTAEELVGVPPALQVAGDLVGEADEGDAPMAGIEVSEDEVKVQKMREQVAELINANPDAAASLVGRWIGEDD